MLATVFKINVFPFTFTATVLPTIETYGSCAAAAAALPLSGCDNKKETKMLWGCVQWGWLFFVVPDAFFCGLHTHSQKAHKH